MKKFLLATLALGAVAIGARAANPVVVMETSMGTIKIELFADKAPITVKNFLSYVDDKFFDNTIFHRVMGKENNRGEDFMIQGGGFTADKKQKDTKPPIKNESDNGLVTLRDSRHGADVDPDSATAQFFINVKDNAFLDRLIPVETGPVIASSARSSTAWTWWTRSRPSAPTSFRWKASCRMAARPWNRHRTSRRKTLS